jgi:ferredoxin
MSSAVKNETSALTLAIDWTRCDGHGLCAVLLSEQISLDEWGFPLVRNPNVSDEKAARRAATACPALALYLETKGQR